ncbi:MAG TPA: hypothetical protein VMV27_02100 [Candidatus Binataceae bacterium]|nr:hypothetical protein [Candidatus Binataceae bacterium]
MHALCLGSRRGEKCTCGCQIGAPADYRTAPPDEPADALVEEGDIIAIMGKGRLSHGIAWLTTPKGGIRVSHVGMIVGAKPPLVNEALTRTRVRPLWVSIADAEHAWILKPLKLHRQFRWSIVERDVTYSAASYDYLKIFLQLADAIAGKIRGRRVSWFMTRLGFWNRPICSYEVGQSFAEEGLNFGVPDRAATPADIMLFAFKHQHDWYRILQIK